MPIEIKELVIRAVTTLDVDEGKHDSQPPSSLEDREAIIQACVKEVMRILKQKKER